MRNRSESNSAGALYIDASSSPSLTNNHFSHNSASSWGGAIFAKNANFSVQGGSFVGNWANLGGGIATDGTVGSTFNGVRILGNEANAASAEGGFAYFNTGSTGSTFVNCVIVGNKSTGRHGVYKPKGTTRFVNCSIVGNQSGEYGGVTLLFNADEVVSVSNSIIWGNSAISGGHDIYNYEGTASINYSIYDPSKSDGTISGTNNLGSDPLFVDANGIDNVYGTEDDDLALQASSPAIDQASSGVTDYPSTDITGASRSGGPDIGAYEYWLTPHSFSYNGVNYEIIQVGATWTDAAQIAVSRGGKLVEIKSSDEQSGIFSALLSAGLNASDTVASDGGGGAYLWIGGNDIAVEGNWAWDGDNDLNTSLLEWYI